jgi:hypothetical protein
MKDNFSTQSDQYAKYRPGYPADFFTFLNSLIPVKDNAWDCGTGNGQVAFELSRSFKNVFATDISRSQLDNARQAENVHYSIQPAEQTDFKENTFDLVTVAQAIHWFDFDRFYAEVKRTAKQNAIICVVGYGGISVSEEINSIKKRFHTDVVGPYWDKERKFVDDNYATLPFPFEEIPAPDFENTMNWDLDHFLGYINTWSAVKKYIKEKGSNPVNGLKDELMHFWENNEKKIVKFPLLIRIGKIIK